MKTIQSHARERALAALLAGALAAAASPAPARADAVVGDAAAGDVRAASRPLEPSSASESREPIELSGIGASAARPIPRRDHDRFELHLGPVTVSLDRIPDAFLDVGGARHPILAGPPAPTSDRYSGERLGWTAGGGDGVFLEGGRVSLWDPLDGHWRAEPTSEYWTGSARLAIRF